jgi:hypothetical protein
MVSRLIIDIGELVKEVVKSGGRKCGRQVGKNYGGNWVVWLLCVFACISVVVVEGACVRIAAGVGLCIVSTLGLSGGGECAGGRSSVVTG